MLALFIAFSVFSYTQRMLFVVQPIGANPDGVTLVIWRREGTNFIDSADAICERKMSKVNLICRGAVLSAIAKGEILLRLPYWEALYSISTGGVHYER